VSNGTELETFYESVGSDAADQPRVAGAWATVGNQVMAAPEPAATRQIAQGPVSAWAVNGDTYWGISHSIDRIAPGCYRGGHSPNMGFYLDRQPIRTDTLLELPDSKSEQVIAEIAQFTTLRPAFTKRGLLYKRGVLLWGPPGSGKTSTLHLLMRLIVDRLGGVALLVDNPGIASGALQLIRRIEPERQVIAILEDMDGLIQHHGVEEYLSLLDGESQVDNIVFVATTNYPERLDKRFVDRPSRFDTVEYVGMPTAQAREVYLRVKEPDLPARVIDEMVAATEGLSIAHLREMIVLTQCFGRSIADAAKRLTASKQRPPDSTKTPEYVGVGFGNKRRA
jgi:energy-coupling factor transporter ATP-binding protein EcfA2